MRKTSVLNLLLGMSLVIALPSLAQTKAEEMDKMVSAYVANQQFMGSVLVTQGDDIIFSKSYGSANIEWDIPNTPTTKFRLASVTKQFTAASILLLEQQGKLKTTDLIKKYFPDSPAAWNKITIYHLLTHSSGVPDFVSFPDFNSFQLLPTTAEKTIQTFRDKPLDFQPGQNVSYSSSGYVVLGALIEKISGKSYEAFVQDNIFTPLQMNDSGYDWNRTVIPHRAAGYKPGASGTINSDYTDMSVPFSAGSLYSTTEDLLKWEKGLFGGKLLSAALLKKMITPYKDDCAMGLFVYKNNGHTSIQHGGETSGFKTDLVYYPNKKITVAVLANLESYTAFEVADALGAIALGEKPLISAPRKEIIVPLDKLNKYLGAYKFEPWANILITLEGNHLISQISNYSIGPIPLFAETESLFFIKSFNAQIEFIEDENHNVTHFVLHQGGKDTKAPKL